MQITHGTLKDTYRKKMNASALIRSLPSADLELWLVKLIGEKSNVGEL